MYNRLTTGRSASTNSITRAACVSGALRRYSNPTPITIPNYNRKTDRHHFGILSS